MPTDLLPALAVAAAGVLGWFGPRAIAALPEPEPEPEPEQEEKPDEPDDEPGSDSPSANEVKPTYVSLASVPRLAPALALASAVLMAAVAWLLPVSVLPAWVVLMAAGASLAYVDVRTRLLPFDLTRPLHLLCLLLVGLAALIERDLSVLVRAVVANVIVFVVFYLIWAIGRLFGSGAFGYGDVRLAAIVGLVLGAVGGREVVIGTYASFLVGSVAGVLLIATRVVPSRYFAFGPYLVLGAVAGVVYPTLT